MSRARFTWILALVACLAAAPLHAADVADEAQFYFERGNQQYRQGRLEEALAAYYASNRLVPNRNVTFNIARCLEQLKRYDEAFRAWVAVDEQQPPESERATVAAAIDRLRPHLALVQIETRPPGATVYVNRRDLGALGQTPKRLALREGQATLILELPGHRPVERAVTLARGQETRVSADLEPIYGTVVLRNVPAGAVVRSEFADGEVVGKAPGPLRLLPGRRALFVSAPGYQTQRVEVEVAPGGTSAVGVALPPLPPTTGAIVVRANVEGALVRVDGREVGFTPAVIEGIPTGVRTVVLLHRDRQHFETTVTVKEGERAYVDARLARADPVVAAATKGVAETAGQAPASVTVLTADEIAAFGWTTVAEAVAGVYGAFSSNDRIYESVGFRGFSPPGDYTNRVLVLVDGHPFNDVLTGQGYVGHDLDVDLADVERIEVVRGPGSVLYGTGALFGVINVVTRWPRAGAHAAAEGTTGTLGTQLGRVSAGAGGQRAAVALSAATMQQLGDRLYAWNDGAVAARADVETAHHLALRARLGTTLFLRAGWNDREKVVPTGTFRTLPAPGTSYRDRRGYAELELNRKLGRLWLRARAAYDESRFHGIYLSSTDPASAAPDDRFTARWATGELLVILPRLLGHFLTAGAEGQEQFRLELGGPSQEAQERAGAARQLVLSGYLQDHWYAARHVWVDAGLRADRYPQGLGTTLNPRLAVIVQPYTGGNTKLFVGRAFRAPSPYERFYNDGGFSQDPAGPLRREVLLSADLEHAHVLTEDLVLTGTVFAAQVRDLIELVPTRPDVVAFANRAGNVRSLGASGEVRWEPGGGTSLVAAYSWQRVDSLEGGTVTPFPNAPTSVASLRALSALVGPYLRLGNELVVEAGRHTRDGARVDDAALWNITLSGEYRPWRLRYFAGLFNLLDVRGYGSGFPVGPEVPSPTVPRYGRSARLGLSLGF